MLLNEKIVIVQKLAQVNGPPADPWLVEYYGQWWSPYYTFMYHLANTFKPGLQVELGVHNGRGSASLAAGCTSGIVIGCDPAFTPGLEKVQAHCPNFQFVQLSSTDPQSIDAVRKTGRKIGVLHIDTEHNYDQVMNEFKAYKPFLEDQAIILFDDVNAMERSVLKAMNKLPLRYREQCDALHPGCGFGFGIL